MFFILTVCYVSQCLKVGSAQKQTLDSEKEIQVQIVYFNDERKCGEFVLWQLCFPQLPSLHGSRLKLAMVETWTRLGRQK